MLKYCKNKISIFEHVYEVKAGVKQKKSKKIASAVSKMCFFLPLEP